MYREDAEENLVVVAVESEKGNFILRSYVVARSFSLQRVKKTK